MKKSTLLMVLSLVLALTIGLGTTLAYLTDTDSDVNVMTLGNVDIEQIEKERVEQTNSGKDELQDYTQGKPLYPAVGDPAWAEGDNGRVYQEWPTGGSSAMFDAEKLQNVQDKIVFVENTGKSDAYIRTVFAFELAEGWTVEDVKGDKKIHLNKNDINEAPGHYDWEWVETPVVIDGQTYAIATATYVGKDQTHQNGILPAGETSRPSLLQVFMDSSLNNDDIESLGETYDILVVSQAVQTAGFEDVNENGTAADEALNEAFGEITADNHPWLGVAPNDAPTKLNVVDNAEDTLASLEAGKDVYGAEGANNELIMRTEGPISLDAEGAKVVLNGNDRATGGFSYLGFVPPQGQDVKLSNLKVTGTGFVEVGHHPVKQSGGGTYTVNNLEIKDMNATLDINEGGNYIAAAFSHYGNATLNDCVMTGTTSVAEDAKPYDAAFVNGTKTTIKGGEYGKVYLAAQAHVTISDAEVGEIDSCAITTRNLGKLTIGAGAHVGTINLTPSGTYTPALVIEEGAVVDTIIYKGVSYTQAEWLAR